MIDFFHRWITRPWVIGALSVALAALMVWGAGPGPGPTQGPSGKPSEVRAVT